MTDDARNVSPGAPSVGSPGDADATLPPASSTSSHEQTLPPRTYTVLSGDQQAETISPADNSEIAQNPLKANNLDGVTIGHETGDGSASLAAADTPPGYLIERELGRGGMGIVYLARHVRLNRLVALKMVLSGAHAGHQELIRFLQEAESIAHLHHPNIVAIYEVGTHAGRPFFTLEFCEGGNLAQKLAGSPVPPKEAAELSRILARAVAHAHAAGIVHRDLKPQNVLLASDGSPKVTDFGLAKRTGSGSDLTATGAVMGTPSYMSPEQAQGAKDAGPSSDVYSLGAILYECLTGRPPFRAATAFDTILQVVADDPAPPRQLNPQVPPDLETICLKCLQKFPDKRYQSADALVDDLSRWLNGEPISARPPTQWERWRRWVRKHPVRAFAIIAVSVLAGVTLWFNEQKYEIQRVQLEAVEAAERDALKSAADARGSAEVARREKNAADIAREAANTEKRTADAAREVADREREEALSMLYATRINLARREWLHGLSYSAREFLAQAPQKRRGWEYDFLQGLFSQERCILRSTVQPHFVAGSSDGSLIASSSSHEPNLHIWDALTGLELATVPDVNRPQLLRFAPRGHKLACVTKPVIRLIDAATRRVIWTTTGFDSPVIALNWSADERSLHTVTLDGQYRRIDAAKGEVGLPGPFKVKIDPVTPQLLGLGISPVISQDGRYFAAINDDDDSVKVWDLSNGQLVFTATDHERFIGQLAFSPDSKMLASAGGEGTIVVR
ncbi:MAG TPA: protein kinase, partial [Gemmata sp.]|nr:protein kinase [Gemmata sp.]